MADVEQPSGEALAAIQRVATVPNVRKEDGEKKGNVAVGGLRTATVTADVGVGDSAGGVEGDEIGPPIEWVPNEVLCIIFLTLDAKTLMTIVPQVCKLWRKACQEDLCDVHLDFTWWVGEDFKYSLAFKGWERTREYRQIDHYFSDWSTEYQGIIAKFTSAYGGGGGGDGRCKIPAGAEQQEGAGAGAGVGAGGGAEGSGEWVSGMCKLFPRATYITMEIGYEALEAHVKMLAANCFALTHANFGKCKSLPDTAVLALVDTCHTCRALTHADLSGCRNLTDAAVIALADTCRGLKHVDFFGCNNLTDAAVIAVADKCRGLTYADFGCWNLTDAAVLALADNKCPLTHAKFRNCKNLTDVALMALADKCGAGLTHAYFGGCRKLTDAALIALTDTCGAGLTQAYFNGCINLTDAALLMLADKCTGLTHARFVGCSKLTDATKAAIQDQLPNCRFTL